jgi:glycosyltransferase involved in cell wall biosynthesis
MTAAPLISVVIPSYNQAPFLEECIRSVLDQRLPEAELIVIDGGSTDGSAEMIRGFAGRLAYWHSRPDRGQADAVNIGWAKARGAILGWLNSDDRLEPGSLARAAEAARRVPDPAMLYGDVREIDARGTGLAVKRMAGFGLRTLLLGKNMPQPGVFVGRAAYRSLGGLNPGLHYALDFEYFLRIWTAFPDRCVYLDGIVAASRVWPETKSLRAGSQWGEEYRNVLDEYFRRPDLPAEIRALRRRSIANAALFRQARLHLRGGRARLGLSWLARAAWMSRSPADAARMARVAWVAWREHRSDGG